MYLAINLPRHIATLVDIILLTASRPFKVLRLVCAKIINIMPI